MVTCIRRIFVLTWWGGLFPLETLSEGRVGPVLLRKRANAFLKPSVLLFAGSFENKLHRQNTLIDFSTYVEEVSAAKKWEY